MSNEISSFRQSQNKLKIVAKTGNNVEASFDFVERTKFYDKLGRHCCRFGNSRMMLRQSRPLLWHCCWCGRGFTVVKCTMVKSVSSMYRCTLHRCILHSRQQSWRLAWHTRRRLTCSADNDRISRAHWVHSSAAVGWTQDSTSRLRTTLTLTLVVAVVVVVV